MAPHPTLRADGPVLLFGGPYSNLEATRALLDEAARLRVPPARIVCTGDVVAYGADAALTVDLVRNAGIHVVMGNCEENLAAGAENCGCGFAPGSLCERLSVAWFAHADRELGAEARAWMARLPRRIDLDIVGRRLAVVHGGVESINRFVFASSAASIKVDELKLADADGIVAGHCGLPFTQIVNGKLWHNAGVVGLPAHDGTPRAWFSLLTPQDGDLVIEHRPLTYDHAAAAEKMRHAGLPQGYADALETGLWPSCDVLPFREIRARGVPLEESRFVWSPARAGKPSRRRQIVVEQLWPDENRDSVAPLAQQKFADPRVTASGAPRAVVPLARLRTLWFNTGTLCNIACRNCYIESSPKNDRLVHLTRAEVRDYLDEIKRDNWDTEEIGFTGGEPFMNPDLFGMLEDCLAAGFRVLVLTNAMRPMQRVKQKLLDLNCRLGENLTIRVSLDHFTPERHEDERGTRTYQPTLDGLVWLAQHGFKVSVAGRTMWGEDDAAERAGYAALFEQHGVPVDAQDPATLVLFPEMDRRADVEEIAEASWGILGKSPDDVMCATSRMVVKRKGAERPAVLACTLVPYDDQFELGPTLRDAARAVPLNHPHCARFCVLGSASCG